MQRHERIHGEFILQAKSFEEVARILPDSQAWQHDESG